MILACTSFCRILYAVDLSADLVPADLTHVGFPQRLEDPQMASQTGVEVPSSHTQRSYWTPTHRFNYLQGCGSQNGSPVDTKIQPGWKSLIFNFMCS